MATIIIRNSTGSGAVPSSLVQGELAINTVDGKLFYGSGSGNVVKEFTGSAGGTINTGSLLATASFSNPNLTFTKGDGSTFNVNLTSLVPTSASFASTASYVLNAISSSFASTASFLNTLNQNLTFNGNLTLNGTASISTLVINQTQYSSGSNQLGDAANDTQTLYGSVIIPTGSLVVTGSTTSTGGFTGSLFGTASWANNALTASFISTASTNAFVQGGNSFGTQALLGTNDNQNLAFETNGSVRMLINSSSGNVGFINSIIVTGSITTGVASSANGTVTINRSSGTVGLIIRGSDGNTVGAGNIPVYEPYNYADASHNFNIGHASIGNYNWYAGSNATLNLNTQLMRLTRGGNLLIGTTTDLARLTVRGSGTTSATTALRVENTNASASLVVLDDGAVGIGTTSPSSSILLDVSGSIRSFNVLPAANGSYDLGVSANRFRNGWFAGSLIAATGYFSNLFFGVTNLGIYNSTSTQIAQMFGTGDLVLQNGGTFTNNNYRLQVNATGSTNSGSLFLGGTTIATGSIARTMLISSSLSASANNDVLVGLDINSSFNAGSFTGVERTAIRFGTIKIGLTAGGQDRIDFGSQVNIQRSGENILTATTVSTSLNSRATSVPILFTLNQGVTEVGRFAATTGNFLLQNGGTFTDAGFRLDVSGSARITDGLTVTGSLIATSFTGSLLGTSSWATSASQAITASYILNAVSSSFATSASFASTASYVLNAVSSSFASTASFVATASWANSASNAINAQTASFLPVGTYNITSSWAINALTASFVNTASTNAFVQGGNSFGAQALLGTNDNQNLALETSGSIRMFINSSSGNVGIGTTTDAGYKLTVSGGLLLTGSAFNAPLVLSDQNYIYGGGNTSSANAIFGVTSTQTELYARNNRIGIWGSGGSSNYLYSVNGDFGIGVGAITPSARLHISGASSANLLRIDSPASSSILFVSGSGNVGIGTATPAYLLDVSGDARATNLYTGIIYARSSALQYISAGGSSLNQHLFTVTSNQNPTSGDTFLGNFSSTFNPTSGTATYANIRLVPIINQTGGANGITRGLYINPTLTSAADFRAIETTSGSVSFNHGATSLMFISSSGNVGINTNTPGMSLSVVGNAQFGFTSTSAGARLHTRGAGNTNASTSFRAENANQSPALRITDDLSARFDGKVSIGSGNFPTASLDVAGTTRLSGSFNTAISGSILTVIGSGSTQPIFTVQGSQGELFSITDSLSGSLFSVNDISGLPILEVFSDNTTLIGDYQDPMLITTKKVTMTNSGSFVVYSLPTASYDTAFFDYSIKSGSNARAGQIMAIQSGASVNFTETTTTDFGSTTAVSFTVIVLGSNMVLTGSAATGSWTIKTIVRGI